MFDTLASACFRLAGKPAFRIHGRSRHERAWRTIEVHATHRRDQDSRWPGPFFRGTCITWTASIIAVGWDFAEEVLREQMTEPASREHPVEVLGGRLNDRDRRLEAGGLPWASASEILAHEVGHTAQARKMGLVYWPIGALFTLWREGKGFHHWFENAASETGLFGGLVNGSVHPELMARITNDLRPR